MNSQNSRQIHPRWAPASSMPHSDVWLVGWRQAIMICVGDDIAFFQLDKWNKSLYSIKDHLFIMKLLAVERSGSCEYKRSALTIVAAKPLRPCFETNPLKNSCFLLCLIKHCMIRWGSAVSESEEKGDLSHGGWPSIASVQSCFHCLAHPMEGGVGLHALWAETNSPRLSSLPTFLYQHMIL